VKEYRVSLTAQVYEMDAKGTMLPISSLEAPASIQKAICEAIWAASLALQKEDGDLTLLAALSAPAIAADEEEV